MSILSIKTEDKIKKLLGEYESNKLIIHQGIKGSMNENGLAELIKDVIPSRYKIAKGLVENSRGEQSNESDIIIYDDDILPPYIKNDLSVVPVEAVKYIFEVKSTLNSTELQSTINKYVNFKNIGGICPSALVAYSSDIKGNELERYYRNDNNFLSNPAISVLCVLGKSYYYRITKEYHLNEFFNNTAWWAAIAKASNIDGNYDINKMSAEFKNNNYLNKLSRSEFAEKIKSFTLAQANRDNLDKNDVVFNRVKFSEIKFKIHKWIGLDYNNSTPDNSIELSLLSGISNTLSTGNFGNYLLNEKPLNIKTYGICFEDMWGNLSSMDFNKDGIKYNTDTFLVNYISDGSKNTHEIKFTIADQNAG